MVSTTLFVVNMGHSLHSVQCPAVAAGVAVKLSFNHLLQDCLPFIFVAYYFQLHKSEKNKHRLKTTACQKFSLGNFFIPKIHLDPFLTSKRWRSYPAEAILRLVACPTIYHANPPSPSFLVVIIRKFEAFKQFMDFMVWGCKGIRF